MACDHAIQLAVGAVRVCVRPVGPSGRRHAAHCLHAPHPSLHQPNGLYGQVSTFKKHLFYQPYAARLRTLPLASPGKMSELHLRYAPFARQDAYGPMGCYVPAREKLRLALVWLTPLPLLKVVMSLVTLCSFAVVCTVARLLPWAVQRRLMPPLAWLHVRVVLLCFGFLWIRRTRLGGSGSKAQPVCVVSNHTSWADILIFMAEMFPSFVAKATIRKLPLVGVISDTMGCIYVERELRVERVERAERESRGAEGNGAAALVRDRLLKRARDPSSCQPLLLFPEGTTTNGKYLLPFKSGAFLTGAPVQPVILRYRWRRFSPAWETITAARHFFFTFSQLYQSLELVYLPVYEPNDAERADPALYAAGVRAAMLAASGLEASPLTLADKRAYQTALLEERAASKTKMA